MDRWVEGSMGRWAGGSTERWVDGWARRAVEADVLLRAAREKKSVAMTAQRVCTKMTGVCKKVPSWPEGKVRKNEQFKPRDQKDDDIEKLLESMKGMPGGGGLTMMRPGDMDLGDDKVDEIDVLKDEM